jgi:hypothetical protein
MDSNHRYPHEKQPFWLPLFGPRNSPSAQKPAVCAREAANLSHEQAGEFRTVRVNGKSAPCAPNWWRTAAALCLRFALRFMAIRRG